MHCTDVLQLLPAFQYGELAAPEREAVQSHLTGCAVCQKEAAALGQVREQLDALPVPLVKVDLARLQQDALARQERRLRRWRRTTWAAVSALAAGVLLFLLPALELRFEGHQFTLRWGHPPVAMAIPAPADHAHAEAELREVREKLRVLSELLQVMADDFNRLDQQHRTDLRTVRGQLFALQGWVRLQLAENERNLTAVYQLTRQGENR